MALALGSEAKMALCSARAFSEQDDEKSLGYDLKVQADGPVLGIIHIEFNHSLITHVASPPNLPWPRKTWHDLKSPCISLWVEGQKLFAVAKLKGARANQTHLTAKDIDQLRKLVEAVFSQELTKARDPGITTQLEEYTASGFIAFFECAKTLLGVDAHRAEFDNSKQPPTISTPRLAEKNWPLAFKTDEQSNDQDHRS